MKTSVDLRSIPSGLDGKPLGQETLAQIAATALMQSNEGPAVKLYSIAQELFKAGCATLDKADLELIRGQIEASKTLINLAKAQIMGQVDDALAQLRDKEKTGK